MNLIKLLTAFFAALFFSFSAIAQNKGQISGSLTDTSGKKPVPYATLTVFNAKDTSIITYRLSDDEGKFKVPGLPFDKELRVVITASGFQGWRKEFTLTANASMLDMGRIKMLISTKELEEVIVTSERPPVVVRKDTIEFNATAFKTLPTALVEDLLKKLPGVEVDAQGNITVNGRKVNKMLVEGKEFFGSDPKIASKNLPANLIDKVQIADDKEEQLRNPDISTGELGQVINLKLKKSIKQGWFGKLYAGAGTRNRYEAGGIVNMFRDTLQISVLGFSNNLNRSGFSVQDVMSIGGFSRNNVNSISVSSDGGFALNDISFGGLGAGIQRSSGGGMNLNTLLSKKTTLSFQYFYGNNNSQIGQRINTQQFFNDTTLTIRNSSQADNDDFSHRISGLLRNKPNALTTIEYRPSFSFTSGRDYSNSSSFSFSNFDQQLNESVNEQRRKRNGFSTSHDLSYNRAFKKAGKTLYATANFTLNSNDANQYNNANNIFYKAGYSSVLRQLRSQEQDNWNGRMLVNYNQPLSKAWSLRLSQNIELFSNKDYIDTYEYDPVTGEYIVPDQLLTNGLKRSGLRSSSSVGFRYVHKKFAIIPGVALRALNIDNRFRKDAAINQHFLFLFPSMNITWDKWSLNYQVTATEPQVSDLQPVVNNTNPLFVQQGNPSLKPTVSHSVSISAYNYNVKNSINYNLNMNGSISEDAVIRMRTVDANGVQVSRPINADGVWRGYISGSIRKQYKFTQKLLFSLGASVYAQYNQALVIINQNRSTTKNINAGPSLNWSLNWADKIEINQRYGPSYIKSTYESDVYPSLKVWRHTAGTDFVIRMPKHIVWESSVDYSYNPQVAAGIQKNVFRWNAAVNLLFLKQDKGQFKLSVYDLLNQNISVQRSVQENFIRDTETIILRRYFLLTFTYNIRSFGGKVGGRERFLLF
ncbi:MAG: TonB-dependent receptor [Chitinophagaceae bacterium]